MCHTDIESSTRAKPGEQEDAIIKNNPKPVGLNVKGAHWSKHSSKMILYIY